MDKKEETDIATLINRSSRVVYSEKKDYYVFGCKKKIVLMYQRSRSTFSSRCSSEMSARHLWLIEMFQTPENSCIRMLFSVI